MKDKYTLINVASFKNGKQIPLYKVYGDGGVEYEAIVYGRSHRGLIGVSGKFRHPHRSKVVAWREARRADAR